MSSSDSRFNDDLDQYYELALRIACERSKVETAVNSGSAASLLPSRRSSDTDVGPSRPVRSSDARLAQPVPSYVIPCPRGLLLPHVGSGGVLVPAQPDRTRMPESEARAARHERQRQRERRETRAAHAPLSRDGGGAR
ncbi:hypothetical protein D1007_43837 [Hordeum vulgare]|nr:hypothetical protein D1007_43837 [Hordeum vulgare]